MAAMTAPPPTSRDGGRGVGMKVLMAQAIAAPRNSPTRQPTRVRVAASTRNWNMISPRVAPSALRTPISRVRSVTEIIMIATTPTPPTMRPTPDSASMTRKKPCVIWLKESRNRSELTTVKLFSCRGLRPRDARRLAMTSSMASCTVAASVGITAICIHPFSTTLVKVV
jgi:hypothetical protein